MATPILTSLPRVKDWLASDKLSASDDSLLNSLISQMSGFVSNWLSRPNVFYQQYVETSDGNGNELLMLKRYPVIAVSQLLIENNPQSVSANAQQQGYFVEPYDGNPPGQRQRVVARGSYFPNGYSNIQATYTAGYAIIGEAATVPASPYQVTVQQPQGSWGQDIGVTYANGSALLQVAANPAAGQYSISGAGVYQFAAADAAASVLISYSFIPYALENAVVELVGERYRYKQRIGQMSHSVGGQETVSFNIKMPDHIINALQPFKDVALW